MYIESIPIMALQKLKGGSSSFFKMCKIVSETTKKNRISVMFDMLLSALICGSSYEEYYNLAFYKRTYKNRKTYMTTFSNNRLHIKLNDRSFTHYLGNKADFNKKFSAYINRDWVDLDDEFEHVKKFVQKHGKIIIKPKLGHSGKGISILTIDDGIKKEEIEKIIAENKNCIAEEILKNHTDIASLNASSLNTLRIITIVNGGDVDFIYAGIRVGAQGAIVDNISSGGSIAAIDLDSGVIISVFQGKKTSQTGETITKDEIGFQIPCWDEVKQFVCKVALEIPQVSYVAWDVAITTKGMALIEGNHSSGNTINQRHFDCDEEGLKIRLDLIISKKKGNPVMPNS